MFTPGIMRVNRKRAEKSAVGKTEFPFKVLPSGFAHVTNYNYCGRQCAQYLSIRSPSCLKASRSDLLNIFVYRGTIGTKGFCSFFFFCTISPR